MLNVANSGFGTSITSIGDVNGDSLPDMLIGAPYLDSGHVALIHGKERFQSIETLGMASIILTGNEDGDRFGYSIASAGDADKDGILDVIIGAPGGNYAHLYYGSTLQNGILEPDLWEKNLIDEIELWIELGQPDEKRIRKACNRAKRAIIYCYGGQSTSAWWQHIQHKLERLQNLSVIHIPAETSKALAQLVQRGMQLQYMIQDGETWIGDEQTRILVKPETWL